jgi:deoxyribonuclease-4
MIRLGVHTSISGSVDLSLERARQLGCNTIQIFSHNPRQWRTQDIPLKNTIAFKKMSKAYDINPVFIHTSYLINLAAVSSDIFEKSIALLIKEMDLADSIGADYVILHTGSASQDSAENARKKAITALKRVDASGSWKAKLLLENTAGERGDISSRMEDIAEIIDKTDREIIGGVCIDTCHAFAAGYDLTKEEGPAKLADEIRKYIGIENLKLVHLNDSKKGRGSHVDRHEHIGEGAIGLEGLRNFVRHPSFAGIALILETPKKEEDDDVRNLKIVRSFLS